MLGHGHLVKHSFLRSGIRVPKFWDTATLVHISRQAFRNSVSQNSWTRHPRKTFVYVLRKSVSQNRGTRKHRKRKRAGGPDIRVPTLWTRNPRDAFITAVPNSLSQNFGTRKHRKTVDSAVRKSLSEYFGSRKLHNNMSRQGPVAVGIHR